MMEVLQLSAPDWRRGEISGKEKKGRKRKELEIRQMRWGLSAMVVLSETTSVRNVDLLQEKK